MFGFFGLQDNPMKLLLLIHLKKFVAMAVAEAIERGSAKFILTPTTLKYPMAWREGTVQSMVEASGGRYVDQWCCKAAWAAGEARAAGNAER